MRVLITGACGFIGTNLALHLDRQGYDVIGMDISFYEQNYRILSDKKIDVRIGDVTVLRDLKKHCASIDGLVHLAAKTNARTSYVAGNQMLRTNLLGAYNVSRIALEERAEKLIFASSGAVYGSCKGQKWHPYLSYCKPMNVYGLTKLMGEQLFDLTEEENPNGSDVYKLRMSNVYGPWCGRKESFIPAMIKAALSETPLTIHGNGKQKRDFIYVKDLCERIEKCLDSKLTPGTHNMATGKSVSVNEVLRKFGKVVNDLPEPQYDPSADYGVEDVSFEIVSLAHGNLPPSKTLEDGLRETWGWAKRNLTKRR